MTCPVCDKPGTGRYRPFCSRRCADIDLAHWLRGSYAIPTDEPSTLLEMQRPLVSDDGAEEE